MTSRTSRQTARREKYAGDPYVPLAPKHLAAALKGDSRSLSEISAALRAAGTPCSKQNLYHLSTKARECRASLRRGLAATLGVSERWLQAAPRATSPLAYLPLISRTASEEVQLDQIDAADRAPPRAVLAAERFLERVFDAMKRDVAAATEAKGKGTSWGARNREAEAYVACWQSLLWWTSPSLGRVFLVPEAPQLTTAEVDAAAIAGVRALEVILEPWLSGKAQLDYGALGSLRTPGGRPTPSGRLGDPFDVTPKKDQHFAQQVEDLARWLPDFGVEGGEAAERFQRGLEKVIAPLRRPERGRDTLARVRRAAEAHERTKG